MLTRFSPKNLASLRENSSTCASAGVCLSEAQGPGTCPQQHAAPEEPGTSTSCRLRNIIPTAVIFLFNNQYGWMLALILLILSSGTSVHLTSLFTSPSTELSALNAIIPYSRSPADTKMCRSQAPPLKQHRDLKITYGTSLQ